MTKSILARAADSVLVVIDIQDRLAAAINPEVREATIANTRLLLQAAALVDVPVLFTEQYSNGLGSTVPRILEMMPAAASRFEKTCFSCAGADGFLDALDATGRTQVILAGMDAAVCVLQSAIELLAVRPEIFVVEDACCSRIPGNHRSAMARMASAGVIVAATESILFEWLRDSRHQHFRRILTLLR